MRWFNSQGSSCRRVLSDNGSAYCSKKWRQTYGALDLKKAKRTRAYRPQTNGMAERFIKTLQAKWADAMPLNSSEGCRKWPPRCLSIYNVNSTCPSAAALPFSSSNSCLPLNVLVRKHI